MQLYDLQGAGLMVAAANGHIHITALLLEVGADTMLLDRRDRHALMWAAATGQLHARFLMTGGRKRFFYTENASPPDHKRHAGAISLENSPVARLAEIHAAKGEALLGLVIISTRSRSMDGLRFLLSEAATSKRFELIERGANTTVANNSGRSHACCCGWYDADM